MSDHFNKEAHYHNFVNLHSDFKEYAESDKNPFGYTLMKTYDFIYKVIEKDEDKFIRLGYSIDGDNQLCWNLKPNSIMKKLHEEFKSLKAELFGDSLFVRVDDSDPKWKRYDQLLGYFRPQFRKKNWVSPI